MRPSDVANLTYKQQNMSRIFYFETVFPKSDFCPIKNGLLLLFEIEYGKMQTHCTLDLETEQQIKSTETICIDL